MRPFYSSTLLDGVRNFKAQFNPKIKHFLRLVGILRVYLDSGDDFQWGLGRQMDRAKQLHLDHFRSHGDFIDSKKKSEGKKCQISIKLFFMSLGQHVVSYQYCQDFSNQVEGQFHSRGRSTQVSFGIGFYSGRNSGKCWISKKKWDISSGFSPTVILLG